MHYNRLIGKFQINNVVSGALDRLNYEDPCVKYDVKEIIMLVYATATVFQLYHGGDMYEIRRRKPRDFIFTDSRDL